MNIPIITNILNTESSVLNKKELLQFEFYIVWEFFTFEFAKGEEGNCFCSNIPKQQVAFLTNKDKTPTEIYLMNPSLFKDPQEVSNLKRKYISSNFLNNKYQNFKNNADESQFIENNLTKDDFVQEIHTINKLDVNGINNDLPLTILYDKLVLCVKCCLQL